MLLAGALASCSPPDSTTPEPAHTSEPAPSQPAADPMAGQWVPVDHSDAGYPVFVDKAAIYPVGSSKKRADVGYVDASGRMLARITLDCKTKDVVADSVTGQTDTMPPSYTGDLPRDDQKHGTVLDYVCKGKRSPPERDMPTIGALPATSPKAIAD